MSALFANNGAIASAMILTSGCAHAIVSGVLKSGKDKMSSRALIDGFSALMVAPFVFFLPVPIHAWPWLLGTTVDHLFYLFCLIKAFEAADMSVAYMSATKSTHMCMDLAPAPCGILFHSEGVSNGNGDTHQASC